MTDPRRHDTDPRPPYGDGPGADSPLRRRTPGYEAYRNDSWPSRPGVSPGSFGQDPGAARDALSRPDPELYMPDPYRPDDDPAFRVDETGPRPRRRDTGRRDAARRDPGRGDPARRDPGRRDPGRGDGGRRGRERPDPGPPDPSWPGRDQREVSPPDPSWPGRDPRDPQPDPRPGRDPRDPGSAGPAGATAARAGATATRAGETGTGTAGAGLNRTRAGRAVSLATQPRPAWAGAART